MLGLNLKINIASAISLLAVLLSVFKISNSKLSSDPLAYVNYCNESQKLDLYLKE